LELFAVLSKYSLVSSYKEDFLELTDFDIALLMHGLQQRLDAEAQAQAKAKAKANRR